MNPPFFVEQAQECGPSAWEMRDRSGALRAWITWDEQSGNYYVGADRDFECEFFPTFEEACAFAEGLA